jgi:hypothetical protein
MAARATKILTRIRAGGVVTSRTRLAKDVQNDPSCTLTACRKLRIAGLPNRKAGSLKTGARKPR